MDKGQHDHNSMTGVFNYSFPLGWGYNVCDISYMLWLLYKFRKGAHITDEQYFFKFFLVLSLSDHMTLSNHILSEDEVVNASQNGMG